MFLCDNYENIALIYFSMYFVKSVITFAVHKGKQVKQIKTYSDCMTNVSTLQYRVSQLETLVLSIYEQYV